MDCSKLIKPRDEKSQGHQIFFAYPDNRENEINLADIIRIFAQNKWIILGSLFVATVLAVLIAFSLPNIYRAEIVLLPPTASDVAALTVFDIGQVSIANGAGLRTGATFLVKADPQKVYSEFQKNLKSNGIRWHYFKENRVADILEKNVSENQRTEYETFQKMFEDQIRINSDTKDLNRVLYTKVLLDGALPDVISQCLHDYIRFVDRYTVNIIVRDTQSELDIRIKAINEKIEALKEIARSERRDAIKKINDALVIAQRLGIEIPTGASFIVQSPTNDIKNSATNIILDSQHVPLYLRGYKALQVELEQLQTRKNDDPFIIGLRALQGKATFLENKRISVAKIHSMRIDKNARVQKNPVKPKRKMIVLLGVFLGVLCGLLGAFIKQMSRC